VQVDLHPEALAELRSAALWYEERRPRLGDRFVERVNVTFAHIGEYPAADPVWPGTIGAQIPIHKASVEQFPYLVAFEIHASRVLVLAIAHAKRRPLYWLARASRGWGAARSRISPDRMCPQR
jgi:plasmid stabilization system protein ParE